MNDEMGTRAAVARVMDESTSGSRLVDHTLSLTDLRSLSAGRLSESFIMAMARPVLGLFVGLVILLCYSHLVSGIRNGVTVPPYNVVNVNTFLLDVVSPPALASTIPWFPSIFTGAALPLSNRSDFMIDVPLMLPNVNDHISACNGPWQTQNEFNQTYAGKFVLLLKSTCSGAQYLYAAKSGAAGVVVMGCSPLPPYNCPNEVVQDFSYVGVPTATVFFISNADGVRINNYLLAARAAAVTSGIAPDPNEVVFRIKSTGPIVPEERNALIAIMQQTTMGPFGVNLPQPLPWWTLARFQNMSIDPCRDRTKGIWCEGGHIVLLNLMYHHWQAPNGIPTEFGNFTYLRGMTVRTNEWFGALPDSFCNLQDLRWLWVSDQRGPTGGGLTSLPNCNWPLMGDLQFWKNSVTALPPSLSQWSNIQFLYGTTNKLTGPLPSFANLNKLKIVDISSNLITGSIPTFNSSAPLLKLSLGNNQFSGDLGATAFDGVTTLTVLDLNTNQLTGPLPTLLGCTQLTYVDLSSQRNLASPTGGFTGSMPSNWGLLTQVATLYLQENSLISPFYTYQMVALSVLDASNNYLTYATPTDPNNTDMNNWISTILTPSITKIKLSYNLLGPSGSGLFFIRFPTLRTLYLDHNQITSIFGELFATSLTTFDISYNNLTGAFPLSFPSPDFTLLNMKGNPYLSVPTLPNWMQASPNRLQEAGSKFACAPLLAVGSDSMNVLVDPTFYDYLYCDCLPGNFGRAPLCSPVPTAAKLTPYSIISSDEIGDTFSSLIHDTNGVGSDLTYIPSGSASGTAISQTFSDDMYGENRLTLGLSTSWVVDLKQVYADDVDAYIAQGLTPPSPVQTYTQVSTQPDMTTPVRVITIRLHISAMIMTSFDDVISIYEGGQDLKGTRIYSIRGSDVKPTQTESPYTMTPDYIRINNASLSKVADPRLVEIQIFSPEATVQFTSRMTSGLHFLATYSYDFVCPTDYFYDTISQPGPGFCRPNYEIFQPGYGIRSAVFAVSSVTFLFVVFNLIVLGLFWNSLVYKAASRPFMLLILCLLGAMSLGSLLYAAIPTSGSTGNSVCIGRAWLTCLPLAGILAVILAKTNRLNTIFGSKSLQVKVHSDLDILISVLVVCSAQILLLAIFSGLPLSRPELILGHGSLSDKLVHGCSQETGFMSWLGAEISFISALILPTAYLAFKTRNLPSQYNESTHMQNAIILFAFFGVIIIPLDIFIQDSVEAVILIQGLGQAFLALCLTGIIFGPKLYHLSLTTASGRANCQTHIAGGANTQIQNTSSPGTTGTEGTIIGGTPTTNKKTLPKSSSSREQTQANQPSLTPSGALRTVKHSPSQPKAFPLTARPSGSSNGMMAALPLNERKGDLANNHPAEPGATPTTPAPAATPTSNDDASLHSVRLHILSPDHELLSLPQPAVPQVESNDGASTILSISEMTVPTPQPTISSQSN